MPRDRLQGGDQWSASIGASVDRSTLRQRRFGPDDGCSYYFGAGGRAFVRFHDDSVVTVQCMRPESGDGDVDRRCEAFGAMLGVEP